MVDLVEPGSAGVPRDVGVFSEERYGGLDGSVRVLVGYREHTGCGRTSNLFLGPFVYLTVMTIRELFVVDCRLRLGIIPFTTAPLPDVHLLHGISQRPLVPSRTDKAEAVDQVPA